MPWASIFSSGDEVHTPLGDGTVRRVSENHNSAQVDIKGSLYDIPLDELQKNRGEPVEPEGNPYTHGREVKEGDRVQATDDQDITGTIKTVTQRRVSVEWDDTGTTSDYTKSDVKSGKYIEPLETEPKNEKSEEKTEEQKKYDEEREKRDTDKKASETADDLYGLFNLKDKLEKKIESEVDDELREIREIAKQKQTLEVKIGDKVNTVEGLKHKQLEQLINYASLRLSPLLVGMAGTGKTHAGLQTSQALGLSFYSISVGAQTTKTDIMGYMDASGRYVRTHFRDAYEHGGVFLMDEIDAGNANVLITINAALSNGLAAFPDAMVDRHEDFVFIASANTFGNGANRQYVGRNQLDAATLDRFALIEWHIDDDLEEALTTGLNGKAWYMAVRASRDYVAEKNIRALISPRATQKGCKLLHIGCEVSEVIDATLLGSVPDDKKADVKDVATKVFEKFASTVPKSLPVEVDPPTAIDLLKDIPF